MKDENGSLEANKTGARRKPENGKEVHAETRREDHEKNGII